MPDPPANTVFRPASVAEVTDTLVRASADGMQIRICGSPKSSMEAPGSVQQMFLSSMADVVDFPARDMTVTVQAGLPFGSLQSRLAEENLQLPIDVADDDVSVGAMVAADLSGSRQYGYGTLRDYVIGVEAVDGRGRVFHAGGRVVKNVAGYDLCRLMVGSRGVLGVITQLTFKLKPIPEHSGIQSLRCQSATAFQTALDRLNTTSTRPAAIDFSASKDAAAGTYSINLLFEGTAAVCDWQVEELEREFSTEQDIELEAFERTSSQQWKAITAANDQLRIRCRPSQVPGVAMKLLQNGLPSSGHAGNGIVSVESGDLSKAELRSTCDDVAAEFQAIVSDWNTDHPGLSADKHVQSLRDALDPQRIFVIG